MRTNVTGHTFMVVFDYYVFLFGVNIYLCTGCSGKVLVYITPIRNALCLSPEGLPVNFWVCEDLRTYLPHTGHTVPPIVCTCLKCIQVL